MALDDFDACWSGVPCKTGVAPHRVPGFQATMAVDTMTGLHQPAPAGQWKAILQLVERYFEGNAAS
ncbi:hypothetical protein EVC45_27860 [Paraburkholderia sp. UYCP14C]|uniref:hypothetical protein n=1 Tax=Paraburkholderia sp. UYCP14C TaxID=2511130 RepID=UPI001020984C|nr:hypothetical protein [Paraburkholderia sp. UYCP14C]RZF26528.1 hypothetical protein EVC45_27860 [Paraburkholderia sp. UYCP14C]